MKDGRVYISGIAVKEGTSRNKRKYIAKELEKFAPTLQGKPILLDHEGLSLNTIGKITETKYNPETTEVSYKGWIKGKEIIERVKDGRVSTVSIGAMAGKVVKETKDSDILIPIDMEALELSTTPVPGNKGTSLSFEKTKIDLSETSIKKMIEDYSSQSSDILNKNKKEDLKMSEKTTENKSVSVDYEAQLNTMKEELEAMKKANEALEADKAGFLEKERLAAISKYNEACEAKGIKALDFAEASMEKIEFAMSIVESIPMKEEAEVVEEPVAEEPVKEEPVVEEPAKEEEKPKAEPQTKEVEQEEESKESFEGFVITNEGVTGRGIALFKYY